MLECKTCRRLLMDLQTFINRFVPRIFVSSLTHPVFGVSFFSQTVYCWGPQFFLERRPALSRWWCSFVSHGGVRRSGCLPISFSLAIDLSSFGMYALGSGTLEPCLLLCLPACLPLCLRCPPQCFPLCLPCSNPWQGRYHYFTPFPMHVQGSGRVLGTLEPSGLCLPHLPQLPVIEGSLEV